MSICTVSFFTLGCTKALGVLLPSFVEQLDISVTEAGLSAGIGLAIAKLLGIGLGLPLTARILILTEYFEDNFNTANGIGFAGGAVGMIVLPPSVELAISYYGWRGALLVSSVVSFNICVAGAAMKQRAKIIEPPKNAQDYNIIQSTGDISDSDDEYRETQTSYKSTASQNMIGNSSEHRSNCFTGFLDKLGFSTVVHNPPLVLYLFAFTLQEAALTGWMLFLFTYASKIGFDSQVASFLSSAGGFKLLTIEKQVVARAILEEKKLKLQAMVENSVQLEVGQA
ncbi:monocarboxylate transporter 1-like [Amphiura filiformis]|uniref:monocarboxylate transporter 1-like n=1 Tax=Amphiura filiformis TaxID=82378 RepID=UPI003B20CFE7